MFWAKNILEFCPFYNGYIAQQHILPHVLGWFKQGTTFPDILIPVAIGFLAASLISFFLSLLFRREGLFLIISLWCPIFQILVDDDLHMLYLLCSMIYIMFWELSYTPHPPFDSEILYSLYKLFADYGFSYPIKSRRWWSCYESERQLQMHILIFRIVKVNKKNCYMKKNSITKTLE